MKIKVENISFRKYIELDSDKRGTYNYYMRFSTLRGKDYFELGDVMELSFGFIKDMQEHLNYEGLTWELYLKGISKLLKRSMKHLAGLPLFDLYQSKLFIRDGIDLINKLERENLGHSATAKEEQAGIETFNKYRSFIQFDNLTKGDLLKIDDIRNLSYSLCFTKLKYDYEQVEYKENLNKLMR